MELAEQDALNSQELEEASVEAQAFKEKLAESKQEVQQLSHECNHLQEQNRVLQEEDKENRMQFKIAEMIRDSRLWQEAMVREASARLNCGDLATNVVQELLNVRRDTDALMNILGEPLNSRVSFLSSYTVRSLYDTRTT